MGTHFFSPANVMQLLENVRTSNLGFWHKRWKNNVVFLNILPETNIGPENGWLEDEFSFWDGPISGAFAVSFRECTRRGH